MIRLMRKGNKVVMAGIIILLGVSFIFYFSNTDVSTAMSGRHVGEIYDRPVSAVEFQHNARLFNLARDLGMYTFLQEMVAGAQTEDQVYTEFTWNRLVLRHEAERLGIQPAAHEVANVVKDLQQFRGENGAFDINKYNEFTQNVLPAMGFNEDHIQELAADQLRIAKIKDIVGTGFQVSESETQQNYDRAYGKLSVVVARIKTEDVEKEVTVSDEDAAKYYEANGAQLKTDEKRKVEFVTFALNEEQKKLTGKERVEVLQKLADRASEFNQALLEKGADFHQLAAKFQLPVEATGEFTQAAPDPKLAANPELAQAAFRLTPEAPNTDAMQAGDGFYVLHLAGIEPARPLSLEEAKPKIVETLKNQRVRAVVAAKGAEAVQKIRDALKTGAPVEAAVQQTGLPVEKLPPFALADPPTMKMEPGQEAPTPESPDVQMIKGPIGELSPGEVSEFIPTPTGGVVAALERRDPPDAASYEKTKATFVTRVATNRKQLAFAEWLRERRREAGVQTPPEPEAQPVGAG